VVPIEVLGRPIDEAALGRPASHDPFPAAAKRGGRLLVVARHDREKSLDRLIRIFDEHVAAKAPEATLTLLGDGALHEGLKDQAARSRSCQRIFLPGEVAFGELVDWYRNADLFVYTSLSETFGNVVNEALYCGLPVVAFDDRMGVASQVRDGENGRLIAPGTATAEADWGRSCLDLLGDRTLRATLGARGAALAAERGQLDTVLARLELLMEIARQHCLDTVVTPLATLSRAEQERSLRSSLRWWRFWNSLFISLSYAANLDRLPHRLALAIARRSPDRRRHR
jgi:glycosyltransferase involved in cell wall biosynthesis